MSEVCIPSLYAYALGRELATARLRAGVPMCELAARMSVPVYVVMELEMGLDPLHAALVTAWCAALDVPATDVMARVTEEASPAVLGLPIDLRAVVDTRRDADLPVGITAWARTLLTANDSPQIFLPSVEIDRLTKRFGIQKKHLISILRDFVPLPRNHVHQ